MLMSNFAAASISTTRHNLGSTNVAPVHNGPAGNTVTGSPANMFDGTAEICVFCHTPHGADSTASVPIWNRNLSNPSIYIRYSQLGTATFDAEEAPIGSVSIACLSCHDGTQAMNVMINTPGSGTTTTITGNWVGGNVSAGGFMLSGVNGNTTGKGEFPRLGTDLSNDHPVSMQYGGGGISLTTPLGVLNAASFVGTYNPDFAQPCNCSTPSARTVNTAPIGQVGTRVLPSGLTVWWVETDGLPGQSKNDLKLYTRTDGSSGTGSNLAGVLNTTPQPYVECASCHDPHTNNTTFLRRVEGNAGSLTCLTCHDK